MSVAYSPAACDGKGGWLIRSDGLSVQICSAPTTPATDSNLACFLSILQLAIQEGTLSAPAATYFASHPVPSLDSVPGQFIGEVYAVAGRHNYYARTANCPNLCESPENLNYFILVLRWVLARRGLLSPGSQYFFLTRIPFRTSPRSPRRGADKSMAKGLVKSTRRQRIKDSGAPQKK